MELTFFSLLILNMLLVFCGIFSYFFSVEDYTLIAGIIAFIGAIIGGSITLIGVKMTINSAKEKETLENLHARKHALDKTIDQLIKAREEIYQRRRKGDTFDGAIGGLILSLVKTNGIIDSVALSSRKAYEIVLRFDNHLSKLRLDREMREYLDDVKYYSLDVEFSKCIDCLKKEKEKIINSLLEKYPE